jgi:hypothetical protein
MVETAINVPFDSNEVKDIVIAELRKRLDNLSPLTGGKEYVSFSVDFQVKIKLRRSGEAPHEERETLAWGGITRGVTMESIEAVEEQVNGRPAEGTETAELSSSLDSRDPNEERLARDMPLTVETGDGRGGRVRRKVKVKG